MWLSRALTADANIAVAISAADKISNIVINLLHSNTKHICSESEVRIDAEIRMQDLLTAPQSAVSRSQPSLLSQGRVSEGDRCLLDGR
jgi:hypothetical protein